MLVTTSPLLLYGVIVAIFLGFKIQSKRNESRRYVALHAEPPQLVHTKSFGELKRVTLKSIA